MKKVYLKPEIEAVVYMNECIMQDHSDTHIGAKDITFDDGDDEDGPNPNNNLWDGWDD